MGRDYKSNSQDKNSVHNFLSKILMERDCFRDLGLEEILLKWTLKRVWKILDWFIFHLPEVHVYNSGSISWNDWMAENNELQRIGTEVVFA
jgi:hypothetical protein